MENGKKEANIQIGKRLREIRNNLGCKQIEFADTLGVSEEHYRKYESGITGVSADKMLTLYKEFQIDPTYLITGKSIRKFDVEYFMANCSREQREHFLDSVLAYIAKIIKR